jgi:hypothetical protein
MTNKAPACVVIVVFQEKLRAFAMKARWWGLSKRPPKKKPLLIWLKQRLKW